MGNSPSKDDPLPNSSSSSSGQTLGQSASSPNGDLEPDESASALSQFNTSNNKNHFNSYSISPSDSSFDLEKYDNATASRKKPEPSSPRKIHHKHDQSNQVDLDLEISASMAKLLTVNKIGSKVLTAPNVLTNAHGEICSSLESDKSFASSLNSPVFTSLENKDEDSVLSLGSYISNNKSNDLDFMEVKNLDPIVERSSESTPEPRKQSKQKIRRKSSQKFLKQHETILTRSSTNSSSSSSPPLVPVNLKKSLDIDLDGCIDRLLQIGMKKPQNTQRTLKDKLPLSSQEIKVILAKSRSIFLDQPTLLRLSPSVKIVGDIHGQFHDLIRIFNSCGYPPYTNYLFLGDYVDRGYKSLETILLLLCYKIKYPENFFMLRGNHESANITKIYGFYDECKRRLPLISGSHKLWKNFIDVFNTLPIAATINDKIFCIHGGLSPDLHDLKQIENIKRPTDIPDKGLLADLLWSDPDPLMKTFSISNWPKNDRGVSYCFGKKHVDHFLSKFNMDLIVRGHMVVEDGYEFFNKRKFVTIFSAPNYCGEFNNYGAIMSVDKSLCCSFELLKPQ